jgi:hypothetical protein
MTNTRTAVNANVAPIDRDELVRVLAAARQRGYGDGNPGVHCQPRHITPWRHSAALVAGWVWGRLADWWLSRLDRRMARLEGLGR